MSKRILFLALLAVLQPLISSAQSRLNPDSLASLLDQKSGAEKIATLRQISIAYLGNNQEKSLQFATQTLQAAEDFDNDSLIVSSLILLAGCYQNTGDYKSSHPVLDRALALTAQTGNRRQRAEALEYKATAWAARRQTEKALPLAVEALAIATAYKDSVSILNSMEMIAAAHKDLKQYDEAIIIYKQELDMLKYLPHRQFELGRASINLGEVYATLDRNQEAIENYEKGMAAFERLGYTVGALIARLNLGEALLNADRLQEAQSNYEQIITANRDIGEPELESQSITGLGVIAMQQNRYDAALRYFSTADTIARQAGLMNVLKALYEYMNQLFCLKGDYETARNYKKLSDIYADSIVTSETREVLSDLQVQYETAEKDLTIARQDKAIVEKNVINYGLGGSLLALIGIGYLFYNRFRLRKKAELDAAVIREQQLGLNAVIEAQEAERKRIAKDLHDGIAQEMVALKLGFDTLNRRLMRVAPEESTLVGELTEQINQSCTEVRTIAHTMMPPVLEQQGLAPSLELLLRNTLPASNIAYTFNNQLQTQPEEKTAIGLYRIAQELLNNIVKHAHATKVSMELVWSGAKLHMIITDNGNGFDFEQVRNKGSMGILNILSRVNHLGGQIQFNQPPEGGARVEVIV